MTPGRCFPEKSHQCWATRLALRDIAGGHGGSSARGAPGEIEASWCFEMAVNPLPERNGAGAFPPLLTGRQPAAGPLPGRCRTTGSSHHLRPCFSFAAFCTLAFLPNGPGTVKHTGLNHRHADMWCSLPAPLGPSPQPAPLLQPLLFCSHQCLRQCISGGKKPQPSAERLESLIPPFPSQNGPSSDFPLSQPSPLARFPLAFKLMIFSWQQTILTKWVRGTAGPPRRHLRLQIICQEGKGLFRP